MADIDEAPKLTVADFAGAIFGFNKVAAEAFGLAVGRSVIRGMLAQCCASQTEQRWNVLAR